MLVVDLHTLKPVHLLDFVHQVLLQFLLTPDVQNVVGIDRPIHQRLTGPYPVALVHVHIFASRHQVLALFTAVRLHNNLAGAALKSAELHHAVNLGNDGLFLRLASLKQLGHARQPAGDVLGLGGLAGNLRQHVPRRHHFSLRHRNMRAGRKLVAAQRRILLILHRHAGLAFLVVVIEDHLLRQSGLFVQFLLNRQPFHDVAIRDPAGDFRENRAGIRIPLDQILAAFDLLTVPDPQARAVFNGVAFLLAFLFVLNHQDAVAVHDHHGAFAVVYGTQILVTHHPVVLGLQRTLVHLQTRSAADVERPHGELRSRFANRLCGNNTHGLANFGQRPGGQVTPVAHRADAALQLASENRPHDDMLEPGVFDAFGSGFVHQGIADHQNLTAVRVENVLGGNASQDPFSEGFDDLTALHQGRHRHPAEGLTIMRQDNHVLRHVHQAAGQIARVGRLEGGVRKPFSRSVRRNEILQYAQAFAEIRGDRGFHDFPARLGHESAHAGKLSNLLQTATRARVRPRRAAAVHHVKVLALELLEHLARNLLGHLCPDIHNLVIPFAVCDEALAVLALDVDNLSLGFIDQGLLHHRNVHVVDSDRQPRLGGVLEPQRLEVFQELHGPFLADTLVALRHQVRQGTLVHLPVHALESQLGRKDLAQQNPTHRGGNHVRTHAHPNPRLQADLLRIERDTNLLGAREQLVLTEATASFLGQVVAAHDDVLAGNRQGLAVRRRQDIVHRQHERLGLDLSFNGKGHVHGHLVAVEIRVERRTHQRVDTDRLSLHQHGLKGLNAEPVQGGRTIQKNRILVDDLVKGVPYLGQPFFHHPFRTLDGVDVPVFFELVIDERLEELERHGFRQPALVQLELRPDHDHRAPRIVDPFPQEVLAEPALFALQHVARLMTRRYRSFRSEVANRPPSRGTSGRSSGGMTGMTSRIIHSGRLSDLRKASTTFNRLMIFLRFWSEDDSCISERRESASSSRSRRRNSSRIASAPMPVTTSALGSSRRDSS